MPPRGLCFLLLVASLACSGRTDASAPTTPPPTEVAVAECAMGCGPLDMCVAGVCKKNPFMSSPSDVSPKQDEAEDDEPPVRARCPYPKKKIPPVEEVTKLKLAEVSPRRTRRLDMTKKGETLSDDVLDAHLAPIHTKLFDCIDLGACYSETPLTGGTFDFQIALASSGKVVAASVKASESLALPPIIACARRTVAEVKFPSFNGTMTVDYAVTIE